MKYKDINREFLLQYMPATILWLEALDASIADNEIVICDTDHAYDSLRIYFETYNSSEPHYSRLIRDYIDSHCCLCGSSHDVSVEKYDGRSSSHMFHTFCGHCSSKRQGIYARIRYNIINGIKDHVNPKLRVKLRDGSISYLRANDLMFRGNSFRVSRRPQDIVQVVGVDLGLRDKNDERVYDGDILICKTADKRTFWGMICEAPYKSELGRYLISHGGHNFPTIFDLAKEYVVIGNVGEVSDFSGFGPTDELYEKWLMEHEERLNNYLNGEEI